MNIFGITVVSSDGLLNRSQEDSPVNWASKEDQEFYLGKMIAEKPICIMGYNTYLEVKRVPHKDEIYADFDVLILNDKIDYGDQAYLPLKENKRHIYIKIEKHDALTIVKQFSKFFRKENISILGGAIVYEFFLPFYDEFFLTVENNILFQSGIPLFEDCKNTKDIENKFLANGLKLHSEKKLGKSTSLYYFKK